MANYPPGNSLDPSLANFNLATAGVSLFQVVLRGHSEGSDSQVNCIHAKYLCLRVYDLWTERPQERHREGKRERERERQRVIQ